MTYQSPLLAAIDEPMRALGYTRVEARYVPTREVVEPARERVIVDA